MPAGLILEIGCNIAGQSGVEANIRENIPKSLSKRCLEPLRGAVLDIRGSIFEPQKRSWSSLGHVWLKCWGLLGRFSLEGSDLRGPGSLFGSSGLPFGSPGPHVELQGLPFGVFCVTFHEKRTLCKMYKHLRKTFIFHGLAVIGDIF